MKVSIFSRFVHYDFNFCTSRIRSFSQEDAENNEVAISNDNLDGQNVTADELLGNVKNVQISTESSFLAKIAIALGIAATITLISVGIKGPPTIGLSNGFQFLPESATSSVKAVAPVGFTVKAFGYSIVLPAYAPGYMLNFTSCEESFLKLA